MAISFDKAFGIHQYTLGVRSKRAEVLSSNIANADTPGFKARAKRQGCGQIGYAIAAAHRSRQHRGAARAAQGVLAERVGETHSARGEAVDVGRDVDL